MSHNFDPTTEFCTKCGCSLKDHIEGTRWHCDELGNMVGISHIIAYRRFKPLIDQIMKASSNEQSYPA